MKKRIIGALAALALACIGSSAFATGIGIQGGYTPGVAGANGAYGPAITFKLNSFDGVFAVDFDLSGSQLNGVGVTCDYWMQNPRLSGMIHYYWGPGFAASYGINQKNISAAFRAVAGVNVFPVNFLEVYAQVAWQPSLTIYFNNSPFGYNLTATPVNAGIRFWF